MSAVWTTHLPTDSYVPSETPTECQLLYCVYLHYVHTW